MATTILLVIGGMFALVGLVLLAVERRPGNREIASELWRLYRVEVGVIGFILLPAYAGPGTFLCAMTLLAVAAQAELVRILIPDGSPGLRLSLAGAATGLVYGASVSGGWALAMVVVTVQAALIVDVFAPPRRPSGGRLYRCAFVLVYPPLFLGYLVRLRALPDGFLLVALLYVVVETCDTFALLFGKLVGTTQAFPQLSPGKTVAGVVGGLVAGGLAGLLVGVVATPLPLAGVVAATGVGLTGALVGDLAASKIKRNLGVKDFASGLTGHGGVLDVYDTVIFAAPLFYWVVAG